METSVSLFPSRAVRHGKHVSLVLLSVVPSPRCSLRLHQRQRGLILRYVPLDLACMQMSCTLLLCAPQRPSSSTFASSGATGQRVRQSQPAAVSTQPTRPLTSILRKRTAQNQPPNPDAEATGAEQVAARRRSGQGVLLADAISLASTASNFPELGVAVTDATSADGTASTSKGP
jgi:hypothetical protein